MGEITVMMTTHEDGNSASVMEKNNSVIEELETALEGLLHIKNGIDQAQDNLLALGEDEICLQENQMLPVLGNHQAGQCNRKAHSCLGKSATFPSSGRAPLSVMSVDGKREGPDADMHSQSSCGSPYLTRSISTPTPTKLVSAMKGAREKQGTPRPMKLNVSWAPDVYDPPTTSLSHTVKGHHRRPKATKKKDHKHKHKGKSSRVSSSRVSRRSTGSTDLMHSRLLPLDGFVQSHAEVDECEEPSEAVSHAEVGRLAVSSQDSKCGSSFRASLTKLHLSITEAA